MAVDGDQNAVRETNFAGKPMGPGNAYGNAIVPIENTLAGSVIENYDLLLKFHFPILAETRVRIVHGSGMGVLKRAISQMLATHPQVERYAQASQGEGGAGATIVELKQ